jgi:hypothetical protein
VITNFNRIENAIQVKLPDDLLKYLNLTGSREFTDLLTGTRYNTMDIAKGLDLTLPATSGMLLEF